jgi:hypothetical protein
VLAAVDGQRGRIAAEAAPDAVLVETPA